MFLVEDNGKRMKLLLVVINCATDDGRPEIRFVFSQVHDGIKSAETTRYYANRRQWSGRAQRSRDDLWVKYRGSPRSEFSVLCAQLQYSTVRVFRSAALEVLSSLFATYVFKIGAYRYFHYTTYSTARPSGVHFPPSVFCFRAVKQRARILYM